MSFLSSRALWGESSVWHRIIRSGNFSRLTPEESKLVDYIKALTIIAVVVGHYAWIPFDIIKPYIYHMPLFFILGGITMTPIRRTLPWLVKLLKGYVVYIAVWYTLLGWLAVWFNTSWNTSIGIDWGPEGIWNVITKPIISNVHNNALFLVAWFLLAYFVASTVFRLLLTALDRLGIRAISAYLLALGLVLGWCSIEWLAPHYRQVDSSWYFNLLSQSMTGFMFLAIGYAIKPWLSRLTQFNVWLAIVVVMFAMVGGGWLERFIMSWSQYSHGFALTLAGALMGSYILLAVAMWLTSIQSSGWLRIVGRQSKAIMALHLAAFVVVDLFFINVPWFDTGTFQSRDIQALNHYYNRSLWPVYMVVGVVLPLWIGLLSDRLTSMGSGLLSYPRVDKRPVVSTLS